VSKKISHLHIGTSGWHYDHWRKIFYPKDLPKDKWFQFYQKEFDTVEINNTFYQLPKLKTVKSWKKQAASDFLYSIKMSRYATHLKRLKDPVTSTKKFFSRIKYLNGKAGCILHQLPPSFKNKQMNYKRLESYLKALPSDYKHVIEFRDDSWFDDQVYKLLTEYNCSLCLVSAPDFPEVFEITADFAYIRFHGRKSIYSSSYSKKALNKWSKQIKNLLKDSTEVFAYFNNDAKGYAVKNALELIELLS
jgi:uncharacterized protein YecE (DUF72 family)